MEKMKISAMQVNFAVWHIAIDIKKTEWVPDIIVGLTRGGLVPAVMLSHAMNVPMTTLHWSTRDFPQKETLECLRKYRNVLIVDDICDSGKTLTELLYDLNLVAPLTKAKTAVLVHKHIHPYTPDFHFFNVHEAEKDRWVEFYWENTA